MDVNGGKRSNSSSSSSSSSNAVQAPGLSGTHNYRQEVLEGYRDKDEKEHSNCGHDHDHGGHCGPGGDEYDYDLSQDPSLAQCCLKENELRRKANHVRNALERADPIRQIEEKIRNVTLMENGRTTPSGWISACFRAAFIPANEKQQQQQQQLMRDKETDQGQDQEEEPNTDDELDAMLEDFEETFPPESFSSNSGIRDECKDRIQKEFEPLEMCFNDMELAKFLAHVRTDEEEQEKEQEILAKLVVFKSDGDVDASLDNSILKMVQSIVSKDKSLVAAAVPLKELVVGKQHALFNSKWFVDSLFDFKPPFVVVFEPAKLLTMQGFPRSILEKGVNVVQCWWETTRPNLERVAKEAKRDEQYGRDVKEQYCDRDGCGRTWPHEHMSAMKPK